MPIIMEAQALDGVLDRDEELLALAPPPLPERQLVQPRSHLAGMKVARQAVLAAGIVALVVLAGAVYPGRRQASFLGARGVQQLYGSMPAMPPNCQTGPMPTLWEQSGGTPTRLKILSYNLYWWNLFGIQHGAGGIAGKLITDAGRGEPFDIMGFQECEDGQRVLSDAGLLDRYTVFGGDDTGTSAICVAFNNQRWELLKHGISYVATDAATEYFGKRSAQWVRLRNQETGRTVFFMNHHGPLPVGSGGQCGGQATAFNMLELMREEAMQGDAIVLVGDFNASPGTGTILHLEERLNRLFTGISFGGTDNIFSNLPAPAVISRDRLGTGGSDHQAITMTLQLGTGPAPATTAPATAVPATTEPPITSTTAYWMRYPPTTTAAPPQTTKAWGSIMPDNLDYRHGFITVQASPRAMAQVGTTPAPAQPVAQESSCKASFGAHVGDQACCGQSDHVEYETHICPSDRPRCVGYQYLVQWGACQANPQPVRTLVDAMQVVEQADGPASDDVCSRTDFSTSYVYPQGGSADSGVGPMFIEEHRPVPLPAMCCGRCNSVSGCRTWTWRQDGGLCQLWSGEPTWKEQRPGCTSGFSADPVPAVMFQK